MIIIAPHGSKTIPIIEHCTLPELAGTVYYSCLGKEKSPEETPDGRTERQTN
jgi:hypothetical protein